MPTGRPDYWYGTALYFDDSPGDGEITRGPTCNWAYDHVNDADAHHVPTAGGDLDHADLTNVLASQHHTKYLNSEAVAAMGAKGDANALHHDRYADAEAEAACEAIVDDTPVNGATDQPVSSNWAFDHKANASAHHAKYNPADEDQIELGGNRGSDGFAFLDLNAESGVDYNSRMIRESGENGKLIFYQLGTEHVYFYLGGNLRLAILSAGGLSGVWDDTPTNGQIYKGVTSDWAFDHTADADAHHAVFVDRGDPSAMDWDITDLSVENTWTDLVLSGIVPAGAIAVLFLGFVTNDLTGSEMALRKNGNIQQVSRAALRTQVSGVAMFGQMTCACDANRVVEYFVTGGMDALGLVVMGWWI